MYYYAQTIGHNIDEYWALLYNMTLIYVVATYGYPVITRRKAVLENQEFFVKKITMFQVFFLISNFQVIISLLYIGK